MTSEFQELTKESIELEKEREQLDALIDGLRDRCDSLEAQLSDEKLRWAGIKSPGLPNGGDVREGTSMMVLRQEFKKMMREQRAEAMKMLRVSLIFLFGSVWCGRFANLWSRPNKKNGANSKPNCASFDRRTDLLQSRCGVLVGRLRLFQRPKRS
jgi:hypothetical protein